MSAARLLLDTQALLYLVSGEKVPEKVNRLVQAPDTETYLSSASLWEIAIKTSRGSALSLDISIEELHRMCMSGGMKTLDLRVAHFSTLRKLPWHHKDPFDRLLIAQAKAEGLTLVGSDAAFRKYDVRSIWE